jgi:hypothetical protein
VNEFFVMDVRQQPSVLLLRLLLLQGVSDSRSAPDISQFGTFILLGAWFFILFLLDGLFLSTADAKVMANCKTLMMGGVDPNFRVQVVVSSRPSSFGTPAEPRTLDHTTSSDFFLLYAVYHTRDTALSSTSGSFCPMFDRPATGKQHPTSSRQTKFDELTLSFTNIKNKIYKCALSPSIAVVPGAPESGESRRRQALS